MRKFGKFVFTKILRWHIYGTFPDIPKSVVTFAPHTSYIDSVYGKFYFLSVGKRIVYMVNQKFFFFPLNIILKWYGGIPVKGVKGKNAIFQATEILKNNENVHIAINPEGGHPKSTKWNRGFLYIAQKANVPIVVGFLDYKTKEVGVKGVIYDISDEKAVMRQLHDWYYGTTARHPELFDVEPVD